MSALLNTAWIGLGANLPSEAGHPADTLRTALQQLGALPGITLQAASGLYDSAPVDSSGPWYCNQVVRAGTSLDAPALLAALQGIEQAFGRQRPYRNAPRTLDLDVLLFNDEVRTDTPARAAIRADAAGRNRRSAACARAGHGGSAAGTAAGHSPRPGLPADGGLISHLPDCPLKSTRGTTRHFFMQRGRIRKQGCPSRKGLPCDDGGIHAPKGRDKRRSSAAASR